MINLHLFYFHLLLSLLSFFLWILLSSSSVEEKPNLEAIQSSIQKLPHHMNQLIWASKNWQANNISIQSFISNKFENFTKNFSIMIFPMAFLYIDGFGNRYGQYLETYACADLIGAHFITVNQKWNVNEFNGLPNIVYHKNPSDRKTALSKISTCSRFQWPWTKYPAAWSINIKAIDATLTPFIFSHVRRAHGSKMSLIKPSTIRNVKLRASSLYDLSSLYFTKEERNFIQPRKFQQFFIESKRREAIYHKYDIQYSGSELPFVSASLKSALVPLIPNAAIYFRCHDILALDDKETIFGFLNFNFYIEAIPSRVETIYILTESLHSSPVPENNSNSSNSSSNNSNPNVQACKDMIITLVLFLTAYYPSTVNIAVIRGHPKEALAIIQYAEIVVCTASTFCFWPGLNNGDRVYFPLSGLIAGGKPYYLTDSFNWISIPVLQRFHYRIDKDQNRTQLMKIFENLMAIPDPVDCQSTVGLASVDYKGNSFC